ncbi:MAG: hypothetical protein EXR79_13990 [Myxococcales bacterium]|nr:hypothetical protein [Myxococcales bacterium]
MFRSILMAACAAAFLVVPGAAFAGGWCSKTQPCKLATDTCHGGYCVPTWKLCKSSAGCSTWQQCNMACPWGAGGSSTTPGGTGSSGSGGGSSGSGSGSADAGSGAAPKAATDAGAGVPAPPPQDGGGTEDKMWLPVEDTSSDTSTQPVPPGCPTDAGVCLADPKKVPVQPGCQDLCVALMKCDKPFTGAGGSSGSGSDEAKSMPVDGGAAVSDIVAPPADSGPIDPNPAAMQQCVLICSAWKLEKVAAPELKALETCVAASKTNCPQMDKECAAPAKTFQNAALADDSWMLGLGFGVPTSSASSTETFKGGDAGGSLGSDAASAGGTDGAIAPSGGADTAQGTRAGADAAADTTAKPAAAASGTAKASSGCTAAKSPMQGSLGWVGLLLAVVALAWRRRIAAG